MLLKVYFFLGFLFYVIYSYIYEIENSKWFYLVEFKIYMFFVTLYYYDIQLLIRVNRLFYLNELI